MLYKDNNLISTNDERGKRVKRYLAIMAFGLVLALSSLSAPARADLRVCNSTQGFIGVAVGYPVANGWISEGWFHLGAASCKTVLEGPLTSRFYYLYAEDVSGKGRWDGPISMCGLTIKFRIEGLDNCFARGFQKFSFQEIDTQNQSNWMVELREPEVGHDVFGDPLRQFKAN